MFAKRQERIRIEKLVYGGDGLGRLSDGRIIFIPDSLPGEEIETEIYRLEGDYALGRPKTVIKASSWRISPQCEYIPHCGGCQWQHISYEAQLELKEKILKETLERIAHLPREKVRQIIPSPHTLSYRHKLQFHVQPETGALGFLKRRSHQLVPVRRCLLAREEINQVLEALRASAAWLRIAQVARRVDLAVSPAEGQVVFLAWLKLRPSQETIEELLGEVPKLKAFFYWLRGPLPEGPFPQGASYRGRRLFPVPGKTLGLTKDYAFVAAPKVFTQANWPVNLKLISYVMDLVQSESVLDLHCGMGNFIIPLATKVKRAMGVDLDDRAIADALDNRQLWGLERIRLERLSAAECLWQLTKETERFETVVLDPPRSGCKEVVRFLPDVAPEEIIYVSCDPPTLARDLKLLKEIGYIVDHVQPFDMFPQTFHLETVTVLKKKKA
ncbi:23S rRNA (uracil(1939)-C(5))-methyltransferase RlmD [Thermosulfuriphilus sp.]